MVYYMNIMRFFRYAAGMLDYKYKRDKKAQVLYSFTCSQGRVCQKRCRMYIEDSKDKFCYVRHV